MVKTRIDRLIDNSSKPILPGDDLMELSAFTSLVQSGMFIDSDGQGYYSNGKVIFKNEKVFPSEILAGLTKNYSHVVWYNT